MNTNLSKLKSVEFLKGCAIIAIIVTHSIQKLPFNSPVFNIAQYGQMGCQIFFIMSSFTLCLSYDKRKYKIKEFYRKRLKRIVPGYYTMIVVFLVYHLLLKSIGLLKNYNSINPFAILVNILLLNGFFPFANNCVVAGGWYIGTSIIFYCIFPLIWLIFNKIIKHGKLVIMLFPFIILVICAGSQIALCGILHRTDIIANNTFIYFSIVNQLPAIIVGFVLWYVFKNKNYLTIKIPMIKFLLLTLINYILFYSTNPFIFTIIPFISSVSYLYLFIYLTGKRIDGKLSNIIMKFGKNSYAIYLIHTFFAWSFPSFVLLLLDKVNIDISMQVLWFILIIPILVLSFFTGKYFAKFLNWLEGVLFNGRFKNI